jgi:hypothetical protein
MPRVRHRSEAVDVDHGQLVYPSLEDVAVVMSLDKLAPGGGRSTGRRDWWRLQRLAEARQDRPDRARLADRKSAATGGRQECEGQGWFRTRKAA